MRKSKKIPPREALDHETIAALSAAIAPADIAPDRLARMRERVLQGLETTTTVLRSNEGEWQDLLPGIRIKTLHVDRQQGMQTSLWRLAPGARIPPHPHHKDEECLVLEGSISHDGAAYNAGDYLFTRPGMRHKSFTSPSGALLMIRSERVPNALLLRLAMLLPG